MKVYVVEAYGWESHRIFGMFSTMEKAREAQVLVNSLMNKYPLYLPDLDMPCILEYELDSLESIKAEELEAKEEVAYEHTE